MPECECKENGSRSSVLLVIAKALVDRLNLPSYRVKLSCKMHLTYGISHLAVIERID